MQSPQLPVTTRRTCSCDTDGTTGNAGVTEDTENGPLEAGYIGGIADELLCLAQPLLHHLLQPVQ